MIAMPISSGFSLSFWNSSFAYVNEFPSQSKDFHYLLDYLTSLKLPGSHFFFYYFIRYYSTPFTIFMKTQGLQSVWWCCHDEHELYASLNFMLVSWAPFCLTAQLEGCWSSCGITVSTELAAVTLFPLLSIDSLQPQNTRFCKDKPWLLHYLHQTEGVRCFVAESFLMWCFKEIYGVHTFLTSSSSPLGSVVRRPRMSALGSSRS